MAVREIVVHKMTLTEAIKRSYMMSLVSVLIMMITGNIVMVVISPKLLLHQMHVTTTHNLVMALFALGCGFLLSLPYNYYQLKKLAKVVE